MRYITAEDLHGLIDKGELEQIIQEEEVRDLNDPDDKGDYPGLNELERFAIGEVESYAGIRYNLESEWTKTGEDRSDKLPYIIGTIIVYNAYGQGTSIPQFRETNLGNVMESLKEIRDGGKILKGVPLVNGDSNQDGESDEGASVSGWIYEKRRNWRF